jgi:small subunit ribosomal protein S20
MPTTKSAKKSLRRNLTARARNRTVKSALRTHIRKLRELLTADPNAAAATEQLNFCAKRLDQAAAKGVIHKNTASRLKGRLSARSKKAKLEAKAKAAEAKKS